MEVELTEVLKNLIIEKDIEIRNLNITVNDLNNQNAELQKKVKELQSRLLKNETANDEPNAGHSNK